MSPALPHDCWFKIKPGERSNTRESASTAMGKHYAVGQQKKFAAELGVGCTILSKIDRHLTVAKMRFLPWDYSNWSGMPRTDQDQKLTTWCCAIIKLGKAIDVEPLLLAELLRLPRNAKSESIMSGKELAQPLAPRKSNWMPLHQAGKTLKGPANYKLVIEVGPGETVQLVRKKTPDSAPG